MVDSANLTGKFVFAIHRERPSPLSFRFQTQKGVMWTPCAYKVTAPSVSKFFHIVSSSECLPFVFNWEGVENKFQKVWRLVGMR